MTIQAVLVGAIVTAFGVTTIKYNYRFTNLFNRSIFIEKWFGSMYTFMLMTSIAASVIGLLVMAGLWDEFAGLITSPVQGMFGG